jgi:hypothetical protein
VNEGIIHGLEYHGRLFSKDGQPVAAGPYDVEFAFHADQRTSRSNWQERQKDVRVGPDGWFSTVLGQHTPVTPRMFKDRARWVSVRIVRSGRVEDESSPRVCVVGSSLQLIRDVERLDGRLGSAEEALRDLSEQPSPLKLKARLDELATRLDRVEVAELARLSRLVDQMLDRLDGVDADDGRLERLEDRLEDMDGPDGDLVDLNSRVDDVEKRAVRVLEHLEVGPTKVEGLERAVAKLRKEVAALVRLQVMPVASGAGEGDHVSREGDTMSGALTIQKGGLKVESGEISGTLVKVFSVDASQAVRSARVVADHIEIRGELTADNTQRTLQIRRVEGRQGSAKKDGPLWLNARGGYPVVVGNKTEKKGLKVHGAVKASGADLAEHFDGRGPMEPGDLVRMDGGRRVVRSDTPCDTRVVGIVSTQPGVELGHGSVPVALRGTVPCKVVGPIAVGDLLVPADLPGHARAAAPSETVGCLVGKAMEALQQDVGTILVLVL